MSDGQLERFHYYGKKKGWDVFISHSTNDDSHDVYIAVSNYMKAKDLSVFNPTVNLTHYHEINVQAMQNAVIKSKLVIAALSDEFFESEWCEKEIEAARDNNIKVIPVYSGDDHSNKQIDKWVKKFTKDSPFKYIFKENARDVLNKQNTSADRTLEYLAELAHRTGNSEAPRKRSWKVFISHSTKDSSLHVFNIVKTHMKAKGHDVFNPSTDLATEYDKVDNNTMQDAAKRSKIIFAAISEEFFKSRWCQLEIEAAKENNIKVVPVFSGNDYSKNLIDRWIGQYKGTSFGYIFKENARDVLNSYSDGTETTLDQLANLIHK